MDFLLIAMKKNNDKLNKYKIGVAEVLSTRCD